MSILYQTPTEKEEIEEHNRLVQTLEDGVFDNTELKTEEYFRELWRDVSKVGFDLENSNHCIDTCKTLIREEEWIGNLLEKTLKNMELETSWFIRVSFLGCNMEAL